MLARALPIFRFRQIGVAQTMTASVTNNTRFGCAEHAAQYSVDAAPSPSMTLRWSVWCVKLLLRNAPKENHDKRNGNAQGARLNRFERHFRKRHGKCFSQQE